MKKSGKKIVVMVIVLVVLVLVVGLIMAFPMISMRPTETGRIPNTEITAVKNKINSLFFVKSGSGYIMIDAGSDAEAIEQSLQAENINPEDVKHILLTHSDSDHVASLKLFPNAEIYISGDELQMIDGTTKRGGSNSNSLPVGIDNAELMLLADGQELTIDEYNINCITAPGHTPGSVAYLFNGEHLFTGDALRLSNGKLKVHPFSMDNEEAERSVSKLYGVIKESELVLTAHYGHTNAEALEIE